MAPAEKRLRFVFRTGAILFAALVALAILVRPSDPIVDGKKLSEWLVQVVTSEQRVDRLNALESIEKLGERALPLLRSYLEKRDDGPYFRLVRFLRKKNIEALAAPPPASVYQFPALEALARLGRTGESLKSGIAALITNGNPQVSAAAVEALFRTAWGAEDAATVREVIRNQQAYENRVRLLPRSQTATWSPLPVSKLTTPVSPEAREFVINALTASLDHITSQEARARAAYLLGFWREAATNSIPALVRCIVSDPAGFPVVQSALNAIRQIDPNSNLVLPELKIQLSSTNSISRKYAARIAPVFGAEAALLLPALTNLLADANYDIRQSALISIDQITREIRNTQ